MYSLTQGGNVGQMISFILVLIGMGNEEAEAGASALITSVGVIIYIASFVTAWIGRWRKGDITLAGFKK